MLTDHIRDLVFYSTLTSFVLFLVSIFITIGMYRVPVYHPVFIYQLYHFVGFVYRPFKIWQNGVSDIWIYTRVFPSAECILYGTGLINLALFSVIAGFLYTIDRKKRVPTLKPVSLVATKSRGFLIASLLLLCLAFYGISKTTNGFNLEKGYKVLRNSKQAIQLVDVSGYQTMLAEFIQPTCIILFLHPKTRKFSYGIIAAYVGVKLFFASSRSGFVILLIALLLIKIVESRRRYPTLISVTLLLTLATVFDILGFNRNSVKDIYFGRTTVQATFDNYLKSRGSNGLASDACEYDVAMSVFMVVPEQSGWSYGTQYLRMLTWPIPRQVWPDKPVYTSIIDLNEYGNFWVLSHSLYADAYMVIGAPGLLIILFFIGVFLARVYQMALETNSAIHYLFFWLFVVYSQLLFRDGEVTIVYFVGSSMLAVVVMCKLGGLTLWRKS